MTDSESNTYRQVRAMLTRARKDATPGDTVESDEPQPRRCLCTAFLVAFTDDDFDADAEAYAYRKKI